MAFRTLSRNSADVGKTRFIRQSTFRRQIIRDGVVIRCVYPYNLWQLANLTTSGILLRILFHRKLPRTSRPTPIEYLHRRCFTSKRAVYTEFWFLSALRGPTAEFVKAQVSDAGSFRPQGNDTHVLSRALATLLPE